MCMRHAVKLKLMFLISTLIIFCFRMLSVADASAQGTSSDPIDVESMDLSVLFRDMLIESMEVILLEETQNQSASFVRK
jgi:hypothetical protein